MSTELYLECGNCGDELKVERSTLQNNMTDIILYVTPCPKCMRMRGISKQEKEDEKDKDVSSTVR